MSEKKPLVSIVIPCHNSGSTIKETLRSALSQTYTNLEIIVYNNYSNDITEKIVLEFHDPRVKYYKTNELLTMSESWTGASRLGTGDFLLLLCSDDVLDKKAIEILHKGFLSNPKIVQIIGCRKLRTLNGKIEGNLSFLRFKKEKLLLNEDVVRSVAVSGSNPFGETLVVLFNRINLNSCLPWSANYFAHIDVDMYIRMSRLGETLLIPKIVGKWRFGSTNSSTSKSKDLFVSEFKKLIIENYQYSSMNLPRILLIFALIKSRSKKTIRSFIVRVVSMLNL
jgi:glycosyltransferase involved in cell wall biosynthesis